MLNARLLKARMVEQGITQADVAKCLGIARSTVSQKLNGVRPLYLKEADKLATLLSMDAQMFGSIFFGK